ncbi:MAG: SET domain-containing protein-lysine N-methyltransferase [Chlamydiota bacterium]
MQKTQKILFCPDEQLYTIEELEERLSFKFLPRITFETIEMREEVRKRGLEKFENKGVSEESLALGALYIKKIETGYLPKVSIRQMHQDIGHGLFAEEDIVKGDYVGEYTGIVRKNDRRYTEPLNHYCYEYPVPDPIGRSFVIDATSGHLTRFINHSYEPNLQPTHVFYEGYYHLIFIAIANIKKGTQFSYNYGKNYWYIRRSPMNLYFND